MADIPTPQSPTQQLAKQIATALCDARIVPDTKKEELITKLQAGTISAQDWRLLVEMGMTEAGGNGDAAEN